MFYSEHFLQLSALHKTIPAGLSISEELSGFAWEVPPERTAP